MNLQLLGLGGDMSTASSYRLFPSCNKILLIYSIYHAKLPLNLLNNLFSARFRERVNYDIIHIHYPYIDC